MILNSAPTPIDYLVLFIALLYLTLNYLFLYLAISACHMECNSIFYRGSFRPANPTYILPGTNAWELFSHPTSCFFHNQSTIAIWWNSKYALSNYKSLYQWALAPRNEYQLYFRYRYKFCWSTTLHKKPYLFIREWHWAKEIRYVKLYARFYY